MTIVRELYKKKELEYMANVTKFLCNFSWRSSLFLAFINRHVPVPGITLPWGLRAGDTAGLGALV
jgi:hypothetical protein